jgi:hypothetical protein
MLIKELHVTNKWFGVCLSESTARKRTNETRPSEILKCPNELLVLANEATGLDNVCAINQFQVTVI